MEAKDKRDVHSVVTLVVLIASKHSWRKNRTEECHIDVISLELRHLAPPPRGNSSNNSYNSNMLHICLYSKETSGRILFTKTGRKRQERGRKRKHVRVGVP